MYRILPCRNNPQRPFIPWDWATCITSVLRLSCPAVLLVGLVCFEPALQEGSDRAFLSLPLCPRSNSVIIIHTAWAPGTAHNLFFHSLLEHLLLAGQVQSSRVAVWSVGSGFGESCFHACFSSSGCEKVDELFQSLSHSLITYAALRKKDIPPLHR